MGTVAHPLRPLCSWRFPLLRFKCDQHLARAHQKLFAAFALKQSDRRAKRHRAGRWSRDEATLRQNAVQVFEIYRHELQTRPRHAQVVQPALKSSDLSSI